MFEGIKNVITWLPIIWKDRQFDHAYLFNIMEKKLQLMQDFFNSEYAMSMPAEETAKRIMVSKNLIRRLREDKYDDPYFDKIHEKWGEFIFKGTTMEFENVKTKDDKVKASRDIKRAFKYSDQIRKHDLKLLSKYIERYVLSWWD